MQLTAMPFSPLPLCLLPSHCPPPFVQQRVAVVAQLLDPLGRHDPAHPMPTTRPALQNLRGALTQRGSATGRGLPTASACSLPARS